jgi:hypothetical protein|tara:strand:- start:126 stop:509 length:384 start_codon:yes stop_codon:yes gene_type:complete
MIIFLKYIFYISLLLLIIVSIYPGSLIGYFFYNDFHKQPILIENFFGENLNHFLYYLYISLLGFFIYCDTKKLKKVLYKLLFLSIILELVHFIIPFRSFTIIDLLLNISGVIFAYFVIKIYLLFKKS